jgi:hypothetical protein
VSTLWTAFLLLVAICAAFSVALLVIDTMAMFYREHSRARELRRQARKAQWLREQTTALHELIPCRETHLRLRQAHVLCDLIEATQHKRWEEAGIHAADFKMLQALLEVQPPAEPKSDAWVVPAEFRDAQLMNAEWQ